MSFWEGIGAFFASLYAIAMFLIVLLGIPVLLVKVIEQFINLGL